MKKLWRNKVIRLLAYVHLVFLGVAVVLFAHLLYQNNKEYNSAIRQAPFEAIIVPGVPFRDSSWSKIMQLRVYWAKHLYDTGLAKNIIFSGSAVYSPFTESKIMKAYALELGLPDSVLFTESNAEHSTENLYYGNMLAREKGFYTVALASDPFQAYLLTFFRNTQEMDIAFLPAQHSLMKHIDMRTPDIEFTHAWESEFKSLPERESFWTRFTGTLGLRIKKSDMEIIE